MIKAGQVYKAFSDSYVVKIGVDNVKCKAKGILKKDSQGISVGDYVKIENGVIIAVENRRNHFIRPNVSNVDQIIAIVSPEPKPDLVLLDKILINAIKEDVKLIIGVNKKDVDGHLFYKIKDEYRNEKVEVLDLCAKTGEGVSRLKSILSGKLSVFAGQSAVGKTSMVNAMFGLDLKVGDLSEKISRGKHTTTRSEIFEFGDVKIIDSPGFAVLEANIELDDLREYYQEYFEHSSKCKFRGCNHINEPGCMVKELVNNGVLSKERYQRYEQIYYELQKRRINYEKD